MRAVERELLHRAGELVAHVREGLKGLDEHWQRYLRRSLAAQSLRSAAAHLSRGFGERELISALDRRPRPPAVGESLWTRLVHYREAQEHLQTVWSAFDPAALAGVHFMVLRGQKGARAGELREQTGFVRGPYSEIVYEGAPASQVRGQLGALLNRARPAGKGLEAVIQRVAQVHLDFIRVLPFFDGNGRVARLLQRGALQASLDGGELFSIEPVLAQDCAGYYDAIGGSLGARYADAHNPEKWSLYCLKSFVRSARACVEAIEYVAGWAREVDDSVAEAGLDKPVAACVGRAAAGLPLDVELYRCETGVDRAAAQHGIDRLRQTKFAPLCDGEVPGGRLGELIQKMSGSTPTIALYRGAAGN